jgi:hypothetical protein
MKDFFYKILIALVSTVISVAVTAYVYKQQKKETVNYIDSYVGIQHQEFDGSKLRKAGFSFTYNEEEIEAYSLVNISLFNYTQINLEDFRIVVEITPEKGDSINIIEASAGDADDQTEGIKEISDIWLDSISKTSWTYEYNVDVVNTADSVGKPFFKDSYTILTNHKPKVKVTVKEKGFGVIPHKYDHFYKPSIFGSDGAIIFYIGAGFVLYIIAIVKISSYNEGRVNKKKRKFQEQQLAEQLANKAIEYSSKGILDAIVKINQRFEYQEASWFRKLINKMEDPDDEDETELKGTNTKS